jgi:hypothetical protein
MSIQTLKRHVATREQTTRWALKRAFAIALGQACVQHKEEQLLWNCPQPFGFGQARGQHCEK